MGLWPLAPWIRYWIYLDKYHFVANKTENGVSSFLTYIFFSILVVTIWRRDKMADYDEPISDQEKVGFNEKYDPYAMTRTLQ